MKKIIKKVAKKKIITKKKVIAKGEIMTKKKESKKTELEVYVSPGWKLLREGTEVRFISGCGCYLEEKNKDLVKVRITVEEI